MRQRVTEAEIRALDATRRAVQRVPLETGCVKSIGIARMIDAISLIDFALLLIAVSRAERNTDGTTRPAS